MFSIATLEKQYLYFQNQALMFKLQWLLKVHLMLQCNALTQFAHWNNWNLRLTKGLSQDLSKLKTMCQFYFCVIIVIQLVSFCGFFLPSVHSKKCPIFWQAQDVLSRWFNPFTFSWNGSSACFTNTSKQ